MTAEASLDNNRQQEVKQWSMYVHFSAILFGLSGVGFLAPLILWQLKREDLPEIDEHGKNVMNWIISWMIYGVLAFILMFVLIGLLILPILVVTAIVFPIIGGVKASSGIVWRYPLAIRFMK
jgi:uncharacterized Tic20 family protein